MAAHQAILVVAAVTGLVLQAGGAADPHPAAVTLRMDLGDEFQLGLSSGGDGHLNFRLVGCGIRPVPLNTGWTVSLRWQPWMSGADPVTHYVSKAE